MLLVTATVIAVYSAQQHKNLKETTNEGNAVSLQQRIISSGVEVVQNSRPVQEALRCFKQPPLSPPPRQPPPPPQTPGYATDDAKQETGTRSKSMESTCHAQFAGSPPQSSSLRSWASLDTTTSFRSDVRQEWINAVFGPDFPITPAPSSTNLSATISRQGVGLAQLPSYVSYDVSLPAHLEGDKLGITMTRLPLGLYVRSIRPGSEAWCAGIKLNSVLVSLNGMALLAEPSRQALERIWQYEGLCEDHPGDHPRDSKSIGTTGNSSTATGPSSSSDSAQSPIRIRDPVQMTFILHGKLYSVLLLSNPPYGIEWSPCGNFALVKRSYGHGASAGVKRGSIIAAINDTTMHDLDHTTAAAELREAFDAKGGISLQLCFTPSAARSGHFEREFQNAAKPAQKAPRPQVVAQLDGVEVRVHPLLWTREQPTSNTAPNSLAQLAIRVAAGELYSLPRTIKRYPQQKVYKPCPPLKSLLQHWDELDALLFCARYYLSDYNDQVVTIPQTTQDGLLHLCENDDASDVLGEFLLQFVSLICRPDGGSDTHEYRVDRMDLRSMVLQVAKSDIDLTRQLELLVPAWGCSESLRESLVELRTQMEQNELQEPPEEAAPRRIAATSCNAQPETAASASNASIPMDLSICSSAEVPGMESFCTTSPSRDVPLSRTPPDVGSRGKKGGRRPRILGFFRKKKKVITRFSTTRPTTSTSDLSASNHKTTLQTQQVTPPSSPPRLSTPTITTTMLTHTSSTSSNQHETLHVVLGTSTKPRQELTPEPYTNVTTKDTILPNSTLFANTGSFLKELESICIELEGSLLRSFSQKIAEWALQPWSASKGTAMAQVTQVMRERLGSVNRHQPLLNPIDTTEILLSLDPTECYILPSAHFPWLLTFNCRERPLSSTPKLAPQHSRESRQENRQRRRQYHSIFGREKLYRTKVELVSLNGDSGNQQSRSCQQPPEASLAFVLHGTVSGAVVESGRSIPTGSNPAQHTWERGNVLRFESRSSWGAPQTLSLRLSKAIETKDPIASPEGKNPAQHLKEEGFGWVDLGDMWKQVEESSSGEPFTVSWRTQIRLSFSLDDFDEHGDLSQSPLSTSECLDLELKLTTEVVDLSNPTNGCELPKRSLLYKRNDDLRQEMFAIHFINSCDSILKSCGLDLKLLTFRCIPVGKRLGFIEWVPGSVPLSQICRQPIVGSLLAGRRKETTSSSTSANEGDDPLSAVAKAGLTKYESLFRLADEEAMSSGRRRSPSTRNPIREFLRSVAYHPEHPYMIRKDVMDTYIKSCAGYCVITYLLGVGDRHLDNLLLHQSGHFFHCDYSFIFGSDPKKYLPMRITEDMVQGMGGRESDNFAVFLSLASGAFLALRRPENVRHILSLVRLMEPSGLPDMNENKSPEAALLGVRERFKLDLSPDKAMSFMENLIEGSLSNRIWIAVDAIHSLGKRF